MAAVLNDERTSATVLINNKRLLWWAIASTVAVAVMRLIIIFRFDLLVDEALYAWIALRRELTLAPHPPGVPLLVRSMVALFGRQDWAIRLPSFVMLLIAPWLIYALLKQMGAHRFAAWGVILLNAVPIYVGFGMVITPDAPQLFFWCVLLLFTYHALESRRVLPWVGVGMALGLGFAFKYVLVLYVPSLLLCISLSAHWRVHWRRPGLYVAGAISLLMVGLLVAIVGIESTRDALRYHLEDRQHSSFDPANIGVFQLAHLAYISPILYVLAIIAMIRCALIGWREQDHTLLFAFSFSVVMCVFFATVSALTGRKLTREHWDAPAYVAALVGIILLVQRGENGMSKMKHWMHAGIALGYFACGIILVEGVTGWFSRAFHAKAPFSSFRGWNELSKTIDQQFAQLPKDQPRYVLTRNFPSMVEYGFYGRSNATTYKMIDKQDAKWGLAGEWRRANVNVEHMADKLGANVLFVREDADARPQEPDEYAPILAAAFTSAKQLPVFTYEENATVFRRFRLYGCRGLKNLEPLIQRH